MDSEHRRIRRLNIRRSRMLKVLSGDGYGDGKQSVNPFSEAATSEFRILYNDSVSRSLEECCNAELALVRGLRDMIFFYPNQAGVKTLPGIVEYYSKQAIPFEIRSRLQELYRKDRKRKYLEDALLYMLFRDMPGEIYNTIAARLRIPVFEFLPGKRREKFKESKYG